MFTNDQTDQSCPLVPFFVIDQAVLSECWRRGNQLYQALRVLLLTPTTADWLRAHDPKAYEQAQAALLQAQED